MISSARGILDKIGLLRADDGRDGIASYASVNTYRDGNLGEHHGSRARFRIRKSRDVDRAKELGQDDFPQWNGADIVFCSSMRNLHQKQQKALASIDNERRFYQFAEEYCDCLHRFGPGGLDSHRAPLSSSWMIQMVLPFLDIDFNGPEQRLDLYEDIAKLIVDLLFLMRSEANDIVLNQGLWDIVLAKIQELPYTVGFDGNCTPFKLIVELEPDPVLVEKILSMRPTSDRKGLKELFADEQCMCLTFILQKIDDQLDSLSRSQINEYLDLVEDIIGGLMDLEAEEKDSIISSEFRSIIYSGYDTYESLKATLLKNSACSDSTRV